MPSRSAAIAPPPSLTSPIPPVPKGVTGMLMAAFLILPLSSAVSALLILISAGWLFGWRRKHRLPPLAVGAKLWIFLLGAVAISAALSVTPGLSWAGLLLTWGYLIVIWVTAGALDTPERLWQSGRFLFWGSVGWAAVGIVVSLARFHWTFDSAGILITLGTYDHRANSVFMHPNILAGYLLLSLGLGLALRTRDGFSRRMRYNAGIAVILLCLLLTQSRSGWIGTFVVILLAGLLIDRRLLIKGAVAGGFGLIFFYQMIWQRLVVMSTTSFDSNLNRMRVWNSAQQMILERPFFGFGPGSWSEVYPQFRDPQEWENLRNAHSFFLHLGAEYGLIALGLILMLALGLTWRAVTEAWSLPHWRAPVVVIASAMTGYLVMGIFDFIFSEGRNSLLFFTLLGMLCAVRRFVAAEKRQLRELEAS